MECNFKSLLYLILMIPTYLIKFSPQINGKLPATSDWVVNYYPGAKLIKHCQQY